jgi:hypothetical protein
LAGSAKYTRGEPLVAAGAAGAGAAAGAGVDSAGFDSGELELQAAADATTAVRMRAPTTRIAITTPFDTTSGL